MPQPPYAKLLVLVNGGGPQSGPIYPDTFDTIQLAGENIAFWQQQKFELYDFPEGFALPAGWADAGNGTYFYDTDPYPPTFAIDPWGKYMLRLTVNRGLNGAGAKDPMLVDASTALSTVSPIGLRDLGFLEANQFSPEREWTGDEKANLRILDAGAFGSLSGTSLSLGSTRLDPLGSITTTDGSTVPFGGPGLAIPPGSDVWLDGTFTATLFTAAHKFSWGFRGIWDYYRIGSASIAGSGPSTVFSFNPLPFNGSTAAISAIESPIGTLVWRATGIGPPADWIAGPYAVGTLAKKSGNVYIVVDIAGTGTSTTGPSGTGSGIVDNPGPDQIVWDWVAVGSTVPLRWGASVQRLTP